MNYIKFRDYTNQQWGVVITTMPNSPTPLERGERVTIPGRNGSIWRSEHAYDDITLTPSLWVPPKRVSQLPNIKAWLSGSGNLELSPGSSTFYRARVSETIEFAPMDFDAGYQGIVVFECFPFRYFKSAPAITVTSRPSTVSNPGQVFSEPLLRIVGSGDVEISIGAQVFELYELSGSRYVDSESQECYTTDGLKNHLMAGAFPVLSPGDNLITWDGTISSIEIQPRWRSL